MSRSSGFGTLGAVLLAAVAAFLAATTQGGNTVVSESKSAASDSQTGADKKSPKPRRPEPGPSEHGGVLVARLLDQYFGSKLSDVPAQSPTVKKPQLTFNLTSGEGGVSAEFRIAPTAGVEPQFELKTAFDSARAKWLIQSVPDPLTTDLDLLTDGALDALLQAVAAQGYSLDRFDLPWELVDGKTGRVQSKGDAHSRMGAVLFTKTKLEDSSNDLKDDLIVVLIVPESPTTGVDTRALNDALEVALAARKPEDRSYQINVQGPFFSGSAHSLRHGVTQWWKFTEVTNLNVTLAFLSGTAMAAGNKDILTIKPLEHPGGSALQGHFSATVLPIDLLITTLTDDYFAQRGIDESSIAVLSESDTAYGAGAHGRTNWIRFPMHIGSMRSAYAQNANLLFGKGASQDNAPRLSLDLSLQSTDEPQHLLPLLSRTSINQIETTLISELSELYRRRLSAVVIAATDPRDQIFLTQLVKTYAPHTLTVLVGADSLLIHDMNGVTVDEVLVATTYPLTPNTQRYTDDPQTNPTWTVFRNQYAEGVYNAVMVLLADSVSPATAVPPGLLRDYCLPFRRPTEGAAESIGPPLWVTVIRHNEFWPVTCCPVEFPADPYTLRASGRPVKQDAATRLSYDPSRYISLVVVGAVFSAWAIYRGVFYLSFSGWPIAVKQFPLLAASSVCELVALATISWLMLLPFLLNLSLLVFQGEIGQLHTRWTWCLFGSLLLGTLVFTSCRALTQGVAISLELIKARQMKWFLATLVAAVVPIAALTAGISCFSTLSNALASVLLIVVPLLLVGLPCHLLNYPLAGENGGLANWLRWLVIALLCLFVVAVAYYLAFHMWPETLFDDAATINQAPFTCDRMYHITSGVSPLAPLALLCLAIAFVARGGSERAVMCARWSNLDFLKIEPARKLRSSLNNVCEGDGKSFVLRALKWSPLAILVGVALAHYAFHSVDMLDSLSYTWIVFGLLVIMATAMILTTARFYDLAYWLLHTLKLLAAEPLADALRCERLPAKLCKEVEQIFLGAEPALLDMASRALVLRSLVAADPKLAPHDLVTQISDIATKSLADRDLDRVSRLWWNLGAAYEGNSDLVRQLKEKWAGSAEEDKTAQASPARRISVSVASDIPPIECVWSAPSEGGQVVALEDLVAMLVVMQIRTALCCLRKLLYSTLIISMGIAFAVESYPFLPRTPLALAALSVPLVALSLPLLRLFIELSKDRILSQISGSKPQIVEFSGSNILNVTLLVAVPLISGLIYQFPALAKPLYSLRDVISHVQK